MFAHINGLDPVGDLFDAAVVGEGGDDVSSAGRPGWGPWGPAVGDDDDGVGFGLGGGYAGVHVGAACAFESDLVAVVDVLVGVYVGVHRQDPDAVAGNDGGDDGADLGAAWD